MSAQCALSIAALLAASGASEASSVVYDSTDDLSTIHYMPYSLVYGEASGEDSTVGLGDRVSLMQAGALDTVEIAVQRRVATSRMQEFTLALFEAPAGPSGGRTDLDLIGSVTMEVELSAFAGPSAFQNLVFDFEELFVPTDVVWMLTIPDGDTVSPFDIVVPIAGEPSRGSADGEFAWQEYDGEMGEFVYPYNPGDLENNFGAVFTLVPAPASAGLFGLMSLAATRRRARSN
ncbi:MAG: hypothetical protein AAFX05_00795 [Planctomycetota bacterium]